MFIANESNLKPVLTVKHTVLGPLEDPFHFFDADLLLVEMDYVPLDLSCLPC